MLLIVFDGFELKDHRNRDVNAIEILKYCIFNENKNSSLIFSELLIIFPKRMSAPINTPEKGHLHCSVNVSVCDVA